MPAAARSAPDATDDIDERLDVATQARLLRAALKLARGDAAAARVAASTAGQALAELTAAAASAADERTRLQRALSAAESAAGKARAAAVRSETREAEARAAVEAVRKDAAAAIASATAGGGGVGGGRGSMAGGNGGADVRLARALEEVERARTALSAERTAGAEAASAHRRELEALTASVRRADKQRAGAFCLSTEDRERARSRLGS